MPARARTAAAVLLALALPGCAALQKLAAGGFEPPKLAYESWSADALDLDGVTLALHYQLTNPNQLGLDVRTLAYALEVEGVQVGQGELPGGVKVAPRATTPLTIPVRLRWRDVPRFGEILLTRSEVAYRVRGHAGVGTALGTVDLPFDHGDRVAVPRPPSFRIEGVSVRNASLTDLAVDVKLRIENGNRFPLPVGALTYGLRVGQADLLSGGAHPLAAVPPGGSAVVTLPVRVSATGAGQAIADLLRGGAVKLQGLAGFGEVEVPVDVQGSPR